ncbi:hypothetical protein BS78_09G008700 [Paspalum vaginatum]|nr:hypothetical protein BS78_09G008700 [Paspalum vaginatum]
MAEEDEFGDDEAEFAGLEPFFFDEAEAVADHEARMRRPEEEARRKEQCERDLGVHNAAMDKIRRYDPKLRRTHFTRINFVNLCKFDLDEESPLGPMRDTNASIHVDGTVCNEVAGDSANTASSSHDGGRRFYAGTSANIFTVKIASWDVGFLIDVYGTVIARDRLDLKCIYLFQRDRDHAQLIVSKDDSLILTGPKRGLALTDGIYFEVNLRINRGRWHKDEQLSEGLLTLDGGAVRLRDKMVVERDSLDTQLSKAGGYVCSFDVLQGRFSGSIAACTTSIRNSIVLHDSKVAERMAGNANSAMQLLRHVVAVSLKEKLIVTIAARNGDKSTIKFTPRACGGDEKEVTCGSVKMLVKVTWSIIYRSYLF